MSIGHMSANTEAAGIKQKGQQLIQDVIILTSKGIMTTTDKIHQILKN